MCRYSRIRTEVQSCYCYCGKKIESVEKSRFCSDTCEYAELKAQLDLRDWIRETAKHNKALLKGLSYLECIALAQDAVLEKQSVS